MIDNPSPKFQTIFSTPSIVPVRSFNAWYPNPADEAEKYVSSWSIILYGNDDR